MKFGKEFATQMVPEWQEAYMDYSSLKSLLEAILMFRQQNASLPQPAAANTAPAALARRGTLYRAFSGFTSGKNSSRKGDEDVILVDEVLPGGSPEILDGNIHWETTFLRSASYGGDHDVVFFRRLDKEFNKVVRFYKDRVQEVLNEAEELKRQMNAFIALRIKVEKPALANVTGSSNAPSSHWVNERSSLGAINEEDISSSEGVGVQRGDGRSGDKNAMDSLPQPASLEILSHVKINVEETPGSTFKGILLSLRSEMSHSKIELKKVEDLMKKALAEFYNQLRSLKSYSFLNQLAFSKVMKKYDKITSRNASKVYLEMIDKSYLGTCDEVTKLMERVEAAFIKHFANGNRQKGMSTLRPRAKRERHRVSFFLGFFTGCSLALVLALILVSHAMDVLKSPGRAQYMENIFPLYSLFGFIVLHMLMFSANIYFWGRYRVNYPFIFGMKQGMQLGYRDVFLLSTALAVLSLTGVLSNLDMEMNPTTKSFSTFTELVPLGLLIVLLIILFCPLNILYRSSRLSVVRSVFHCFFAPLYKVTLPDFFLADQLTSQVQAIRSLEFYVCYYGWGDFKKRSNNCKESKVYQAFYFVVAVIPYWWRFIQCIRRLVEEKDPMNGLNALKYFSTIIAVVMRTAFDLNQGMSWRILAIVSSTVATLGSTYWDIVLDWGLLRRNSKNPWLRDKLLVPKKSVYYVAMVLNIVLRLAWMQSVLGFREGFFLHKTAITALVACLEIIRRGIWNFFRLENEHLNNVGKYRAFKTVPLPFINDEDAFEVGVKQA